MTWNKSILVIVINCKDQSKKVGILLWKGGKVFEFCCSKFKWTGGVRIRNKHIQILQEM